MVIESSGLLKKAGLSDGDIPFFKVHAAMIKRDIRIFERLYLELEENSRFSHICDLDGYIPIPGASGDSGKWQSQVWRSSVICW